MKATRFGIGLAWLTIGALSGCTSSYVVSSLLCDESSDAKATSRAAGCMTAAAYEIAQDKAEESRENAEADKDETSGIQSKYERRIP
jgi:hypothetical protein